MEPVISQRRLWGPASTQWPQRVGVVVAALLLPAGPAWAGDELIHLSCPDLGTEQTAEVEARVRASLLMSEVVPQQVRLSCQPGQANVAVDSSWGTLTRDVPTTTFRLKDDLVEALDQLLNELSQRRTQAAHAVAPEPAPPSPPVADVPQSLADASSGLAPPLPAALLEERTPSSDRSWKARPAIAAKVTRSELLAEATAESWSSGLGLGGNVAFSLGSRGLRYGLSVGGATATGLNAGFGVNEWRARLELGWQPPWASGLRGALGFGPSLLVITPTGDTFARASTASNAWFAEFVLLRPFWFGNLGLAPSAALRLFSARREVHVDENRRFTLSGLSPALGLGLIYTAN